MVTGHVKILDNQNSVNLEEKLYLLVKILVITY